MQKSAKENTYALKDSDMKFPKISEMLEYYRHNPISHRLSNIGEPVWVPNWKQEQRNRES